MNCKIILFDMDGTLTNTEEGISRCVQYMLESFGIHEPNCTVLRRLKIPGYRSISGCFPILMQGVG